MGSVGGVAGARRRLRLGGVVWGEGDWRSVLVVAPARLVPWGGGAFCTAGLLVSRTASPRVVALNADEAGGELSLDALCEGEWNLCCGLEARPRTFGVRASWVATG